MKLDGGRGVEAAEIPAFLGAAFGEVMTLLADQHLTPAVPPFARCRPSGETFDVEVAEPRTLVRFPCHLA